MELPELGKACEHSTCSRLDFLPYLCSLCKKIFCEDHREFSRHSCPEQYRVDAKVPICPKCNEPIPVKPGDDPNIKVNQHIENNCSKMPKIKTYPNRCNVKGCKKKEVIPFLCRNCKVNFCISHKFEKDHDCKGWVHPSARSQPTKKQPSNNPAPSTSSSAQYRQMTDDEALARALQASLNQESNPPQQRQTRQQEAEGDSSCSLK